jgi:hypothetical protein
LLKVTLFFYSFHLEFITSSSEMKLENTLLSYSIFDMKIILLAIVLYYIFHFQHKHKNNNNNIKINNIKIRKTKPILLITFNTIGYNLEIIKLISISNN